VIIAINYNHEPNHAAILPTKPNSQASHRRYSSSSRPASPRIAADFSSPPAISFTENGDFLCKYSDQGRFTPPFFSRPMGERGSAPEPSVIRIFAYPGYKGAYMGGFNGSQSVEVSSSSSARGSRSVWRGRRAEWSQKVESAHPRPGPCCRRHRRRASLLPGAGTISPRSRDYVSGTERPPLTPSINNFPPPFRAEIVPEAPFVARSRYTCRRARCEPRTTSRELVELGELVDGSATLGARSGKSHLFFFLGVLCK